MKIGLVHAPNKDFTENQNYGLLFAPVWAYVLSTYISKNQNFESQLYDLNMIEKGDITSCDYYFYSGINQDLESLLGVQSYLSSKYPASISFLGGPIAWSFEKASELEKLNSFDHICIGDGELLVPKIMNALEGGQELPKIILTEERFELAQSLPMDANLINKTAKYYYGGVIEVSRGCPFLCEFCDIRVLPDNNRNHCRNIDSIIQELDTYRKNGITNIQLACDNFIGDLDWAKHLVKRILEFNKAHNWNPSFYTWLTINIGNYDDLMKDMRLAGFDNLFIGVESFDNNSLLETSKLQNTKFTLVSTIRNIQSFGFIVVAGLIFGFDSDSEKSFDSTLDGITDSGLLSGDASLLTALPGTPLYRRMRLSDRLREFKHDSLLGGHKYVTNIKYLMSTDTIIDGYITFSKKFMDGDYQYRRLINFYKIIKISDNFMNVNRGGYTDPLVFLKKASTNPTLLFFHLRRMIPIIFSARVYYLFKALLFVIKNKFTHKIGIQYFIFWLFIWVNAISKYGKITANDFDLDSVPNNYDIRKILPDNYREEADEKIPANKINAQFKATSTQLKKIIDIKLMA